MGTGMTGSRANRARPEGSGPENLKLRLARKKAAVLERWLERIMAGYPADSARFFSKEKDRFMNPVGFNISREAEILFGELVAGMNRERLLLSLERILKIRAVQDIAPSEAVGFLFLLKDVVRDPEVTEPGSVSPEEFVDLGARIDRLALMALDVYQGCREKIYEIRLSEARAENERLSRVLVRSGAVSREADERAGEKGIKK